MPSSPTPRLDTASHLVAPPAPDGAAQTLPTFEAGRPRRSRSKKASVTSADTPDANGSTTTADPASPTPTTSQGVGGSEMSTEQVLGGEVDVGAASSGEARSDVAPATVDGRSSAGPQDTDNGIDVFQDFAGMVFRNADADGDGLLSEVEYYSVLQSPSLQLNVDDRQAQRSWDENGAAAVSFPQFVPYLRQLMALAYSDVTDAEEWLQIGFSSDEEPRPLYFNHATGYMTYKTPEYYTTLHPDSAVTAGDGPEAHQFEYLTRATDGMAMTTYVDEAGQRMYLDWETQDWIPVPAEWENDLVAEDEGLM